MHPVASGTVSLPQHERRLSRAKHAADMRMGKQRCEVIGNSVLNACVCCAAYIAARKHVPERDAAANQKGAALGDGGSAVGEAVYTAARAAVRVYAALAEHGGKHTPEAILRMHVEKSSRTACRRRHGSEKQNAAFAIPDRRNLVDDPLAHDCRVGCVLALTASHATAPALRVSAQNRRE